MPPEDIGVAVDGDGISGILTFWCVQSHGKKGDKRTHIQALGVGFDGARSVALERCTDSLFALPSAAPVLTPEQRRGLLEHHIEPTLRRELLYRGIISDEEGYSSDLIGWLEVAPSRCAVRGSSEHGRARPGVHP